ncbi:MAG: tyrosine-type recombinase/integrase, partial [Geminicoccaceae bacterium]
ILAAARNGQDPQAAKSQAREQTAVTLGAVATLYLVRVVGPRQRPRTLAERKRHLERDWKPLAGVPIDSVERAQIAAHLARIAAEHGPIAANRSRGTLHALFVWAMGEGMASGNPVVGTNKPGQERSRARTLKLWELARVWQATEGPGDFNAIVRLLLLTGQRRDEVAGMRWSEVGLEKAVWSLPGRRTKNKRDHDVPLSDAALAVLAFLPRREGRELIFGKAAGPFSGWQYAKARLDKRIAGLQTEDGAQDKAGPKGSVMEPWVLHDLRRTVATLMIEEAGILPHVVEAVINHVSGHRAGVAGVYNRATYAREKREALTRWAEWLLETLGGREGAVVPLRRPAEIS